MSQAVSDTAPAPPCEKDNRYFFFFFITLGLELNDTKVYEPQIRALLVMSQAVSATAPAPPCERESSLAASAREPFALRMSRSMLRGCESV